MTRIQGSVRCILLCGFRKQREGWSRDLGLGSGPRWPLQWMGFGGKMERILQIQVGHFQEGENSNEARGTILIDKDSFLGGIVNVKWNTENKTALRSTRCKGFKCFYDDIHHTLIIMKGHFLNSHFREVLHSLYPNIPKVINHSCRFEILSDQRSEIQTFHCPSGALLRLNWLMILF